ncbi:MAG: inositol-3-phosphate synthase [Nitrososphaeria archaeon]
MSKIKVALAGVGNTASAVVQSPYYYRGKDETSLGGYKVSDVEFVAAFDVNRNKVGKDLSEAIFAEPNITPKFADVDKTGVKVSCGPVLDGVAKHMENIIKPLRKGCSLEEAVEIVKGADVLLSLLPVGSEKATRFYAEVALKAGVAFINTIPAFIASDGSWGKKFKEANLPILGDDVKGQIGATVLHRTLVRLFKLRNVEVIETYQLNVGGNTDFQNMMDENRLVSKRESKTKAVTSVLPYDIGVRIGPSDYVPFLGNTKVAFIYVKGQSYAGFPVTLDVKLSVDDKSMFAYSAMDATRLAKVALDRGESGPINEVCAFYFKHPPVQAASDEEAAEWIKAWLAKKPDILIKM